MRPTVEAVLSLVDGLADPARRQDTTSKLAELFGGDRLILFAPDPELGVPLPAPGLPQMLHGAGEWRRFLEECYRLGEHSGTLRGPDGAAVPAHGCAVPEGAAAVLLGTGATSAGLAVLCPLLPLLGALFRNERQIEVSAVRARSALDAAERARVLAKALQQMRTQMESALEEAQSARADAKRRADEAEWARSAAEEANRAKSSFLATMSHELRTPINAIVGYAQLLDMGLAGPVTPQQRVQLERISASSEHLLALINDILDLAKVEAGRMTVEQEPERVFEVVREALNLVKVQAEQRQIDITVACEETELSYLGDRDRVRQILVNLLTNAIKFTEPGGSVVVDCDITDQPSATALLSGAGPWIRLWVEDTGIGMAGEELRRVFQPFVQVDSGHTRTRGGTGLGLTISRQLAHLMGGDLTLQSELGKGSCFTLWLPAGSASSADLALQAYMEGDAGAEKWPAGLARAGEALQAQLVAVVLTFAQRVGTEPGLSAWVAEMSQSDILDHAPTFVAEVARLLIRLGRTGGDLGALRSGSEVQRIISQIHGADRASRGWTTAALYLEFDILRDEVLKAVRRATAPPADADQQGVLQLVDQLLDWARRASVRSLQGAEADERNSAAQA